jgi:glycerol uptake facilitator-like aquaporin
MFAVEWLTTAIFVAVILSVKKHFGAADLGINALTIGLTLFTMLTWASEISGASVNPAIGLA